MKTEQGREEYGIIEPVQHKLPVINLLRVPHGESALVVAHPAFGPSSLSDNISKMQRFYTHPTTKQRISFRALTTAESLAVAGYDFRNLAKPQIFCPSCLQAGYVLKTAEGVWINPLRTAEGDVIIDEKKLEQQLGKTNRVNGIYLFDGDSSFVPLSSFQMGVQEHGRFLEGGLARGLVHTADNKATTLSSITNNTEYPKGVNVSGFDSVESPYLKLVRLSSYWFIDGDRLDVVGDWIGSDVGGYAFGGLVSGEASAKN